MLFICSPVCTKHMNKCPLYFLESNICLVWDIGPHSSRTPAFHLVFPDTNWPASTAPVQLSKQSWPYSYLLVLNTCSVKMFEFFSQFVKRFKIQHSIHTTQINEELIWVIFFKTLDIRVNKGWSLSMLQALIIQPRGQFSTATLHPYLLLTFCFVALLQSGLLRASFPVSCKWATVHHDTLLMGHVQVQLLVLWQMGHVMYFSLLLAALHHQAAKLHSPVRVVFSNSLADLYTMQETKPNTGICATYQKLMFIYASNKTYCNSA